MNEINNTIKNTKPPKKENNTTKPSIQNTTIPENNTTDNQNESIQNTTIPENTSADNQNENIPVLIDWILSEEGQKIIEETGYVSIIKYYPLRHIF